MKLFATVLTLDLALKSAAQAYWVHDLCRYRDGQPSNIFDSAFHDARDMARRANERLNDDTDEYIEDVFYYIFKVHRNTIEIFDFLNRE